MFEIPILGAPQRPDALIEVCTSFSRKFNLANYGGPQYEAIDLFASRKAQCRAEEVPEVTAELNRQCVDEVEMNARTYILDMKRKAQERTRKAG